MMGLNRRALLVGSAFLCLAIWLWLANRAWTEHQQREGAAIAQQPLNDSTTARLASLTLERDSLRVLVRAADQLNGKLIVALRLTVPPRETTYVHDTLPTVLEPNGTRTAAFGDSTTWAVVRGKVTAPPYPAPLAIDYRVTRPPFSPAVGIVRTGSAYFAVVSWQNEKAEVTVPFVDIPPKQPRVIPYVRGAWSPVGEILTGAGMGFRIKKYEPFVEVQGRASRTDLAAAQLWLGTTYRF